MNKPPDAIIAYLVIGSSALTIAGVIIVDRASRKKHKATLATLAFAKQDLLKNKTPRERYETAQFWKTVLPEI